MRPYFVLELVEGRTITAYCRENRLGLNARLALSRQVCGAVEYAHRNLIVHRDLKPEEVLVSSEGAVKLLDSGIAKLLLPTPTPHTLSTLIGPKMLTPNYASPEQVLGQPTDVYSLGFLLYELLAGRKPYEVDVHTPGEIERIVCGEDPSKPSALLAPEMVPYSARCKATWTTSS